MLVFLLAISSHMIAQVVDTLKSSPIKQDSIPAEKKRYEKRKPWQLVFITGDDTLRKKKPVPDQSGHYGGSRKTRFKGTDDMSKNVFLKFGYGYEEIVNYNTKGLSWKRPSYQPLSFSLEYGFTINLVAGSEVCYVRTKAESFLGEYRTDYREDLVYVSLHGKFYYLLPEKVIIKPYLTGGLNYIFITTNKWIYHLSPQYQDGQRFLNMHIDNDMLAGLILRVGADILPTRHFGVSLNVGWGTSLLNAGLLFRF